MPLLCAYHHIVATNRSHWTFFFMGPLNIYYVQAIENFLRNYPRRVVSQFQASKLFGEAYIKSATYITATNGFRNVGLCL